MNNFSVAKFGGTSMADYEAMVKSANIVLIDNAVRLVVVSACSGMTNRFVALASGNLDEYQRLEEVASIADHHRQILSHISDDAQLHEQLENRISEFAATTVAAKGELSANARAATTDALLSFGELLSSFLFSQVLIQLGAHSTWFDVRTVMATDSRHNKAEPQIEAIAANAQQLLLPQVEQAIVVTQGFIGRNHEGVTTTLGRGGSDYSAALLAEGLQAQCLQIWTDVAGVYTTDPRIAPAAYAMEEISFAEAAELATFGAKVLHPSTLWPAIRQNISVFVGSSRNPKLPGTWIKQTVESAPSYRALATRSNQTLVTVSSLNMLHAHGFLAKVFGILANHKISVDLVTTSEVSVALTLDSVATGSSGLTDEVIAELSEMCDVKVENDLALVAVVGNGLDQQRGVASRLFGKLDNYNLRLICHGASGNNVCFLVSQHEANDIVCSLHREIFE